MKIKRYKKVNRHLNFYINNFGFRQPYQLLADGTFCLAALNNKVNIADNVPRYLQGEIKLLTTQCAIMEMENLGHKLGGALIILKKYGIHKCGHDAKPITAASCLLSMLGQKNDSHYILATQDRDLQQKVREIVGAPLLYFHGKTPVLEQPSEASAQGAKNKIRGYISEAEKRAIDELTKGNEVKRKKRKKGGPNPLSCKKSKKDGKVTKRNDNSAKAKPKVPRHVIDNIS